MCGRFSITTAPEALRGMFDYENFPNLEPRYNVSPTQMIAIIRKIDSGRKELVMVRWGLIPAWAKDAAYAARMINARAETIMEKPSFREAFSKRRCLIPADGFYEWRIQSNLKQPYRIGMEDGSVFAFAALWEKWKAKQSGYGFEEGEEIETVSIITTHANKKLKNIHHRMPVILHPEDFDTWLTPANDTIKCQKLLQPFPSEPMAFYRVAQTVNNPRNDNPKCIEPISA